MMYATKIKMQQGCTHSSGTQEIAAIYIDGCDKPDFYTKAVLHDYLNKSPNSIKVNISPYPYVVPAISAKKEKYVRSEANDTQNDNLLKLPRI